MLNSKGGEKRKSKQQLNVRPLFLSYILTWNYRVFMIYIFPITFCLLHHWYYLEHSVFTLQKQNGSADNQFDSSSVMRKLAPASHVRSAPWHINLKSISLCFHNLLLRLSLSITDLKLKATFSGQNFPEQSPPHTAECFKDVRIDDAKSTSVLWDSPCCWNSWRWEIP